MRIAVTGPPRVGKSTVVRRALDLINRPLGGVLCEEIREDDRRVGFQVLDVATGETGILAHVNAKGPRVGKYGVNISDLERVGIPAIEVGIQRGLVVVDEVAPMELKSSLFIRAVDRALDENVDLLAVVHAKSQHPLVKRVRRESRLVEVSHENRGWLPEWIAAKFEEE